jgi:transcriptional regulator GlxA family with amidase domain
LIEYDAGKAVAAEIAREMIMFVRRGMGQAQFSPILAVQAADREPLRDLQHWILENLHLPLTIEDLADRVHMSPRNFARAFAKQTQVTPARFIETLRLDAARRRLEETSLGLEEIAAQCGFGTAEIMRRCFTRKLGSTPSAFRAIYSQPDTGVMRNRNTKSADRRGLNSRSCPAAVMSDRITRRLCFRSSEGFGESLCSPVCP